MKPPCLCTGREDIRCDDNHCDIAGLARNQCGICYRFHYDPAFRVLWGPGPPRSRPSCLYRGQDVGTTECESCGGRTRLKLFSCSLHGDCTVANRVDGHACCAHCSDYKRENFSLIAPVGTADQELRWEGRCQQRPWHYRITACIPHLNTPEPLELVIATLRHQTEKPYILVIDTGSDPETMSKLEKLRDSDCEIHYIRGHGYMNSSAPVTVALDLSMALCRSEYLYTTHSDAFLVRRDYLSWLLEQCGPNCPAVGYEMSSRSWATDQWRGMVSHTASLFHMPTLRRLGVIWNMEHAYELAGWTQPTSLGWPDTETGANLILRKAGVQPRLIGHEDNFRLHRDNNLIHVRSYPGSKVYFPQGDYHARATQWMDESLTEVRELIRRWDGKIPEAETTDLQTTGGSSAVL